MKTKAKKFSHKLLAAFMAILMAMSCFAAAFTAFGYSNDVDYHDSNVKYNELAWSVLSDEQVATAVLDWADEMLAVYGPQIDNLLKYNMPSSGLYYYQSSDRTFHLNAAGIITASAKVHLHSIDEVMETLESVASVISSYGSFIGDAKNLQLGSTNGVRRSNTSSCDIIRDVLAILQKNCADYNGKDVVGELLRGGFDLGTVGSLANIDIYNILGDALGMSGDAVKSNAVYNIAQHFLFYNTKWFTEEEVTNYENGSWTFKYDTVLREKLNTELLQKINVLVTYADGTSSASRKEAGTVQDPNLVYSTEKGFEGNILLFVYGNDTDGYEKLEIGANDSLFTIGYNALKIAWKTVLHDTLQLVHVNYDVERGHGTNFDNAYYYWAVDPDGGNITWDSSDLASMYSQANLEAWANAKYEAYAAETPEEFLQWVQEDYAYTRTADADSEGKWSDIDSTTLLNKVRYSPLADYGFNMQTGPINLYFLQTGTANIDAFFENDYDDYSSLVGGLNDALIAAVKDLFPERANIIGSRPALTTLNGDASTDAGRKEIASTIIANAAKIVQYTADAIDGNILKAFYAKYGANAALSEANIEEAMIPLMISAIGNINFGDDRPLKDIIHPEDWDKCVDAEDVAYLALEEYLSYVLPENDYTDYETFGLTSSQQLDNILLMARDALIYVIEPYVPVTDSNGDLWLAEDQDHENLDIFQLLNTVACYYADYVSVSGVSGAGRTMGVAPLLGVCDGSGNSTFNTNNTIWQNIDNTANQILPTLGELQYADSSKKGQFSSYDLIWNDIVKGVLNISDVNESSNLRGIANFLYRVITIVSADPIQNTPVIYTVYDILAEFINQLFGSRYTNQGWATIIPARTSSTPFDDFVQKGVIAGTSGTDIGALQKLICSFVEFTGYGTSGPSTYPDTVLPAVAFALTAVNSFMPDVVPQIGAHQLKLATAEFDNAIQQQAKSGTSYDSSVTITNNSIGVNNAYLDGANDNATVRQSRYYIAPSKVEYSTGVTKNISNVTIAPGETYTVSNTTAYSPGGNTYASYYATVTYSIVDNSGTVLYSDLTCKAYQFMTSEQGWEEVVYPDGTKIGSDYRTNDYNQTITKNGYTVYSTADSGKDLVFNYPQYIVLGTDNLSKISDYTYRVYNKSTSFMGIGGNDRGYDGAFCYDMSKDVSGYTYHYVSSVGNSNAIPVWDKQTGDLLRYDLYDYSTDGGETWNRGSKDSTTLAYSGYSEADVSNYINAHPDETVLRRTHVPYTMAEAVSAGIIAAYNVNKAGVYDSVYLRTGTTNRNYDVTLGLISCRGPVDGFYINSEKVTVKKDGGENFISIMSYDGSTPVATGTYPINLRLYSSSDSNVKYNTYDKQMYLVVGDTANASSVSEKYNELATTLANYRESDFTDPQIYEAAQEAMVNALRAQAAALTPTSAVSLSDQQYLAPDTMVVATEYGDEAFVPFTEDNYSDLGMPLGVYADAYSAGDILYLDEEMTMPIYSNTPLTDNDVINEDGMYFDAAYNQVIKGEDGIWYLANSAAYPTEWNLDNGTPMKVYNYDEQATDDNGNLLYNQVQYVYRDANNIKVNSGDDWAAKFPSSSYKMVEATVDNDTRGLYTQANEYLEYVLELVSTSIDPSIAQDLFTEVTAVRHGLNEVNFEVATFNKMVDYAKKIEKLYSLNATFEGYLTNDEGQWIDTDGNVVEDKADAARGTITKTYLSVEDYYNIAENSDNVMISTTTNSALSAIQVAEYVRMFNFYLGKVYERGYMGYQLETEITHSGNSYDKMVGTPTELNPDGTVATAASVAKGAGAADPEYGAWENGVLTNTGDIVYSAATWNSYVDALAQAVYVANLGNGSYAHKTAANYNSADKDNYVAGASDVYEAKVALQVAENRLTPSESVTLTVNGNGADATVDGIAYTAPVGIEKGETVTVAFTVPAGQTLDYISVNGYRYTDTTSVQVTMNEDTTVEAVFAAVGNTVSGSIKVATSAAATSGTVTPYGVFTIDIYSDSTRDTLVASVESTGTGNNTFATPALGAGTYYASVSSDYMIAIENVTIIVDGEDIEDAVIYVVPCDFNGDSVISVPDAKFVYSAAATGTNAEFCDLNGDGVVSVPDAKIVYGFAATGASLAAQTIR